MCAANRQTVDLSKYARNILADEDRPLFDEAVKAGKAGALRAAYVMIWLACAESLKRRFREAQKRDSAAGRIVSDIEKKEREHKSVDKFVLDKAHEYGFLSDSGHTILNHVYEMRCLYGHPYEEAPSQEQVSHAAAVVVEHVLSKAVKLRHGFGKQLLKSLLENRSYLDDQQTAVTAFTKDIIPRLDESIHGWLLDNYWEELEKLADDSSMAIFFRRGIWFCRAMLMEVGVGVFSHDEWHDKVNRFPKTLMRVCSIADLFREIGKRAQDSLVGSILAESGTRSSVLTYLERLDNDGALSKRQKQRFTERVSRLSSSELRSASLSTKTCFQNLINALQSYTWPKQNPAIELIVSNGPGQAAALNEEQQVELGRNILQAADGRAFSACAFLEKLSQDGASWPLDVVRGIALETFTNEKNEIRFKDRHLNRVLSALAHLNKKQREQIVAEIVASVDVGSPKSWVGRKDFDSVIESLRAYKWTAPLISRLEAKAASLPGEDEEW
ncbi:hypothetical protein [Inmirania thermothiophila]|uniref:Uncharacterized protein n=1 Tax=Inmirania thermothiophila TaxID=1750597 RepID=A0A3N1Y166_9GAMM|nr:hypothetical protein [Inmirania thermothiophila]ROR32579.1 hypothetical protein EDC57_1785 [Inmirania thermothiophila]